MNKQAEKHLDRAEDFFERGDEWYGKAAGEIVAAKKADPSLTNKQAAQRFKRSESWVGYLVASWHQTSGVGKPFKMNWERGSHGTTAEIQAGAEKLLATAPLETVEAMIEKLPAKAAAKVAQAALGKTGVARELSKTSEGTAAVFRASGKVSEEVQSQNRQKSKPKKGSARGVIGFLVEVLADLNGAKRKLSDSYTAAREHDLDDDQREAVHEMLDEVVTIIEWYRSYLDSGDQSFEDELSKLLSN